MRALVIALALTLSAPSLASAGDGPYRFHRTTPRAVLDEPGGVLVFGIPGGRAWGIESEARPLPAAGTVLVVRLAVDDEAVTEAFVRVAYYASLTVRTRQLAIADSAPVPAGERALVAVILEPPAGAVAFRVRVLARLRDAAGRSQPDAVSAAVRALRSDGRAFGSVLSRLVD